MPFFKNIEGKQIYYNEINESGSNFPLIFLHGYGSSITMFAKQIPFLSKFFKIILFDAQGHGKSERTQNQLQENLLKRTKNDLKQLLKCLNINGKFGIISHSIFGSNVAIDYALKNSENIEFLILLNPGHLILDSTIKNVFWNLLPQFTRVYFNDIAIYSIDKMMEKIIPFIKSALFINQDEFDVDNGGGDSLNSIEEKLEEIINNPIQPSQLYTNTLIIGAELDNFAPVFMAKYLEKYIPKSELHIVSLTGHFGLEQRYEKYNKIIYNFLKNNSYIEEE